MKRKPCLLLALAGKGQVADGRAVDLLGAAKPANAGQKITERKDAADGDVGEAEVAAMSSRSRPSFTSRVKVSHWVTSSASSRARFSIIDASMAAASSASARMRQGSGSASPVSCATMRGMESTRARDDLEMPRGAIWPNEERLDDPALAHGRQDIAHIGSLATISHVHPAHAKVVLIDKNECHGIAPLGSGATRLPLRSLTRRGVGGPVFTGVAA